MHSHSDDAADAALLELLTAPVPPTSKQTKFSRRDAALDPLMIAAAAASGPHVTRNHYHHDFFPGVMLPQHEGSWDWSKWSPSDSKPRRHLTYVSRQAPRSQRLQQEGLPEAAKENDSSRDKIATSPPSPTKKRRPSLFAQDTEVKSCEKPAEPVKPVEVKCMARTRIPTPHGPAFLHLYHNNRDTKEHMAIVIDSAQYSEPSESVVSAPPIRSHSLDAIWDENETEMDRITRGAYVGRLSPTSRRVSTPASHISPAITDGIPSPLIRIHSECFTGETVGSMRCDCGEQLDEAIRLISQPIPVPSLSALHPTAATIPGRGAVVYLRQEGRGIGLLSKIRAYNLQDLGHDTVTANLMLGHQADERGYEIAAAILRDLGLDDGVRLLTNNPDKVEALQKEGMTVVERVPMVPRSWKSRNPNLQLAGGAEAWQDNTAAEKVAGATLIGGNSVHGPDLDKYLRTKVLRMGHILPLWMEDPEQ
ncbi:GTP cyclohydrolase II-domain-containing protein [Mycena albidolilacea]|uniref:GTP cyclohydrolase II n=1 Tax=Mycena albidolilacea TaxID=1033008 RepID=A0AAD7F4J5_9AGAR|nr:GTP cyclohydrolase II-domain-containing protein [Mycena albidolilacea]